VRLREAMLVLGTVLVAGCTAQFEDEPWRVEAPRVLAIVAEPPEARPGEQVTLTALVGDVDGPSSVVPAWSVCTRPRTSAERTAVTERCLQGRALEPVAATMLVPSDACARFGPNVPPAEGDATPQRPADPDPSGGYFLPVHADVGDAEAFGAVRIRCDLPGVTRAIFDAFEDRYVANVNPRIEAVRLEGEGVAPPDDSPVVRVAAGAQVSIEVVVPGDAAEPYVRYDSGSGTLEDEREWIRVQWLVTDGVLQRSQDTVVPNADGAVVAAPWTAPADPTVVHGWVVLTDARGGSAWQAFSVDVSG